MVAAPNGLWRRFAAFAVVAAVAMPSARASAAPNPPVPNDSPTTGDMAEARDLFGRGDVLFSNRDYDQAIESFREAFALSGEPNCLYNIALAYEKLEDYRGALEYLDHYQAHAPDVDSPELRSKIREVEDAIEQERLEQEARERAAREAAMPEPEPEPEPEPAPPPAQALVPATIATATIAALGLGTGAVLGIVSQNNKVAAADVCGVDADGTRFCAAQADPALRASRRYAIGADISLSVGAVAAVATIVLISVRATRNRRSRAALVAGRRSAGLQVRF